MKNLLNEISDQVGVSLSTKTTIVSGLAGIFSSMAEWNWASIIASCVAIGGLAMNFYFQRRRDKRDREQRLAEKQLAEERLQMERDLNAARIDALRRGCDVE